MQLTIDKPAPRKGLKRLSKFFPGQPCAEAGTQREMA